jgi:hypothetical protein
MGKTKGSIREVLGGRTLADQEAALKDPTFTAVWPAATVHAERKRVARERRRLFGTGQQPSATAPENRGSTCSHAWADAVWKEAAHYPPGAAATRMVTCRACGVPTPPQAVSSAGECDDCRMAREEAEAARARARERAAEAAAAAKAAAAAAELDARGRPIVEPPPDAAGSFQRVLEEMRIRGVRLQETKLPTEDAAVLKSQLDAFLQGRPSALMVDFAA